MLHAQHSLCQFPRQWHGSYHSLQKPWLGSPTLNPISLCLSISSNPEQITAEAAIGSSSYANPNIHGGFSVHKLNAFLTRHTLKHHQKGEGRIGITERVLWSSAVTVNPTYQRLPWAVGICVAMSLLSPFASFVLSEAEPFVVSHTATTQHSSCLTQHCLVILRFSKQVYV